jgi:hypothetical protein
VRAYPEAGGLMKTSDPRQRRNNREQSISRRLDRSDRQTAYAAVDRRGYEVFGTTRSEKKAPELQTAGVTPKQFANFSMAFR